MIEYVKVTNDKGEILVLELKGPEKSGLFVRDVEGLGPAKSTVNMSEALSRDGAYFNSARVATRNLVFDLGFMDTGGDSVELARYKTYRFFPMKRPIEIEVKTSNRTGITYGYVESNEPNVFSNDEGTIISMVCPDAYFFGKEEIETVFTGSNAAFEFPFENPSLNSSLIEFGQIFIDTQKNVFYTGDVSTGVVIYVTVLGNVNDLAIYNDNTGEVMAISSAKLIAQTGSDLKLGDTIVISTTKGNKFIYLIRNGAVINILNTLGVNADWFTIDRGDNVFLYTADSGLSNLQFLIVHRLVYEGL